MMYQFGIILFYVFLFYRAHSVCEEGKNAIDDDYCDCIDGSDEPHTSACSSVQSSKYLCNENSPLKFFIASSRVGDGICDCCDGSDEHNSSYVVNCPNSCESELFELRKDALQIHRKIQAGLQVRGELMSKYSRIADSERRKLDSLRTELVAMKDLIFKMEFQLLYSDSSKETYLRWKLLREREIRCADGFEIFCDLYAKGFLDDAELEFEGIRAADNGVRKTSLSYKYKDEELSAIMKLSGLERIRASVCTAEHLMPDESPRIFGTAGEYFSYLNSAGDAPSRRNHYMIKKQALFGAYMDDADWGLLLFYATIWEAVGLVLSPVTVSTHILHQVYQDWVTAPLYSWMKTCAKMSFGDEYCDSEKCSVMKFHEDLCSGQPFLSNVLDTNALIDGTSTAFVTSLINEYNIGKFPIAALVSKLFVDAVELNHTQAYFIYYNYLDLNRYSFFSFINDLIGPYVLSPLSWGFSIVNMAPYVYYDYYSTRENYLSLPPTRNACLLRSGIEAGKSELEKLSKRIEALASGNSEPAPVTNENKSKFDVIIRDIRVLAMYIYGTIWSRVSEFLPDDNSPAILPDWVGSAVADSMDFFSTSWNRMMADIYSIVGWRKSNPQRVSNKFDSKSNIEFHPELVVKASQLEVLSKVYGDASSLHSWEILYSTLCISSNSSVSFEYSYEFCFFKSVSQRKLNAKHGTGVNLGKFERWSGYAHKNVGNSELKASQLSGQQLLYPGYAQLFAHGDHCGGGTQRQTLVTFICSAAGPQAQDLPNSGDDTLISAKSEILEVKESQRCYYEITVATPLACYEYMERASLERLEFLGVFGFGK